MSGLNRPLHRLLCKIHRQGTDTNVSVCAPLQSRQTTKAVIYFYYLLQNTGVAGLLLKYLWVFCFVMLFILPIKAFIHQKPLCWSLWSNKHVEFISFLIKHFFFPFGEGGEGCYKMVHCLYSFWHVCLFIFAFFALFVGALPPPALYEDAYHCIHDTHSMLCMGYRVHMQAFKRHATGIQTYGMQ